LLFEFKDITYNLGIDGVRNIKVSGALNSGEVLIVQGPSGVGKSTLLRILSRLQTATGGEAFLQAKSWWQIPGTAWRASVHYLAQKPAIFAGSVAYNLAIPFAIKMRNSQTLDINKARELMERLLLPAQLWDQEARTLSGGEASRLAFIRALLINPMVLLLDEPTAALDEPARQSMYKVLSEWLNATDRAALLISHTNDFRQLEHLSFLDIKPLGGSEQYGK